MSRLQDLQKRAENYGIVLEEVGRQEYRLTESISRSEYRTCDLDDAEYMIDEMIRGKELMG